MSYPLWQRAGGFVVEAANFPGNVPPLDRLRTDGFGWVAYHEDDVHAQAAIAATRNQGLLAGSWHVLGDDPLADAAHVDALVEKWNPSFVIIDAEFAYKGWPGTAEYARSAVFVKEFRRLRPTRPAALTCLAHVQDFDYDPWVKADFRFLPQCYGGAMEPFDPVSIVDELAGRVPREKIKPVVGTDADPRALVRAGTNGFSIYRLDAMTLGNYDRFAAYIGHPVAAYG